MIDSLNGWLSLLEQRHPKAIDLGLERCQAVWQRLRQGQRLPPVITVAGTNGKGTTAAAIAALASAHGLRCGLYTSPHLIRYNERVQIEGRQASDHHLVAAFNAVEQVRDTTSLTYFETGTLAALWLFMQSSLDLVVLEVGLGGRLDAVNIVDPAVAVLTSIGLDHQEWLGSDRVSIGREKVGIARTKVPWVCGEADVPEPVLAQVESLGAIAYLINRHFRAEPCVSEHASTVQGTLQFSAWISSAIPHQSDHESSASVNQTDSFGRYFAVLDSHGYLVSNLVTALQALNCWGLELQYDRVQHGLAELRLAGRQTYLQHAPALLVDVAHNPQAAAALAQRLRRDTPVEVSHARLAHAGVTHALFGILDDKDLAETVAPLLGVVDRWHVVDLSKYTARGASAKQLVALLQDSGALVEHVEQAIASACARILAGLSVQDRLVVWGSFYMAGPVLAAYEERLDGSRA